MIPEFADLVHCPPCQQRIREDNRTGAPERWGEKTRGTERKKERQAVTKTEETNTRRRIDPPALLPVFFEVFEIDLFAAISFVALAFCRPR